MLEFDKKLKKIANYKILCNFSINALFAAIFLPSIVLMYG